MIRHLMIRTLVVASLSILGCVDSAERDPLLDEGGDAPASGTEDATGEPPHDLSVCAQTSSPLLSDACMAALDAICIQASDQESCADTPLPNEILSGYVFACAWVSTVHFLGDIETCAQPQVSTRCAAGLRNNFSCVPECDSEFADHGWRAEVDGLSLASCPADGERLEGPFGGVGCSTDNAPPLCECVDIACAAIQP